MLEDDVREHQIEAPVREGPQADPISLHELQVGHICQAGTRPGNHLAGYIQTHQAADLRGHELVHATDAAPEVQGRDVWLQQMLELEEEVPHIPLPRLAELHFALEVVRGDVVAGVLPGTAVPIGFHVRSGRHVPPGGIVSTAHRILGIQPMAGAL